MWLVLERRRLITISSHLLLIVSHALGQPDSTVSTTQDVAKPASSTASVEPTCESRTVNYITHTLPQQCLTSSPSAYATSESATSSSAPVEPTATATTDDGSTVNHDELDADGNDLSTGAFMSFEEWKAMMLEKSGQEALEPKNRKTKDTNGDAYPGEDFDSLGDEGEVSLDFDAYSDKISEITSSTKPSQKEKDKEEQVEKVTYDEGLTQGYRSKDAGKTSKERFSYASFDAGATIKKESRGAKNSKSILVENKDSYMLLECAMENKFVIVELTDDILVDTIVLANFEFFSSMIRHFRVSVSDRYPVKSEKWRVLGTFEARNSRDIQPFLVENPQIWAKYVRIEFLTHYGNEYYCPVSLLRVHGTRMLDSWKEADPADLEVEDDKAVAESSESVEAVDDQPEEVEVAESPEPNNQLIALEQSDFVPYWDESYFYYIYPCNSTCVPADSEEFTSQDSEEHEQDPLAAKPQSVETSEQTASTSSGPSSESSATQPVTQAATESGRPATSSGSGETSTNTVIANSTESISTATSPSDARSASTTPAASTTITPPSLSKTASMKPPSKSKSAASTSVKPPSSRSAASKEKPSGSPTTPRNKTSTTTSSAASAPTVQDSFFKALNKRIQALESNTTLSLQYIESQSLFLREALAKLERRQVAKVDLFLDTLNKTVLGELREVRVQYDQIWQSTVIALETQREQAEREIVALSARLGFLADEVAFQKRMAILQSLLLLGCLVLVIFSSRGGFADSSYYAAQFLGGAGAGISSSRLASPMFPSTPRAQHHPGGSRGDDPSLLSVADASPQGRLRRTPSPSQTPDSARQQPRGSSRGPVTGEETQTPESALRRHQRRPSPGRAATDPAAAAAGFFRASTPSSMEIGYDSEPALTPTREGDGADYYDSTTRDTGDGHDSGRNGGSSYAETLARKSERQLTPSSEADGVEYIGLSSRPPLTHSTSARKPLPALPEDPD
ncbi:hypothetical protein F5Y04DRAFT_256496 [Hypomontagnella monticulosa]|nr:hypothetical protein F5Y04DRAFT_256496 [Hypomontagnella monticulosa]